MKIAQVKELKEWYQDDSIKKKYYPPKKVVSGNIYSFLFSSRNNPLSSCWVECKDENELVWLHDMFYGLIPEPIPGFITLT